MHTTDRASRVATVPLFHACRRQYPGGTARCARRSLPGRWQPSPWNRQVGFSIARFEACSTFTRVAARMVARPPTAARSIGVLQAMSLPPSLAPIATGWNDSCRAGFAPAESRRLSTAHCSIRRSGLRGSRRSGPIPQKLHENRHFECRNLFLRRHNLLQPEPGRVRGSAVRAADFLRCPALLWRQSGHERS